MRIIINEGSGKSRRLHLPSGLMLSRLSATIVSASLRKNRVNISGKQLRTLFRAIKAYKKAHPGWKLVEVHSHKGEIVEIVL